MDPYIQRIFAYLAQHDPITVLEATPGKLEALLLSLSEEDLARSYALGKWNAREILAHLCDCELALGFRFRQVLVETNYRPQSFDQDKWASRYGRLSPSLALAAFQGLRAWNLALFATFDLRDWSKEVDYPFKGIETLDDMVRFLAGHDLNHLEQLQQIAACRKN